MDLAIEPAALLAQDVAERGAVGDAQLGGGGWRRGARIGGEIGAAKDRPRDRPR